MVVGRDYMLKKTTGPSMPTLFFHSRIVPGAVNFAGALEVALDRASIRTGVRPSLICVGVAALALVTARRALATRP